MPEHSGHPVRSAVVVLAAGAGTRVGGETNKILMPLAGVPVVTRSVRVACGVPGVVRVVLVVREGEQDAVRSAVEPHLEPGGPEVAMVVGGATRHRSEWAALTVLATAIEAGDVEVVAMHDAARPLADPRLYNAVLTAARRVGGASPVAPLTDLVSVDGGLLPPGLVGVQTPQAFRARDLLAAHRAAEADGYEATDTAGILAAYSDVPVAAVASSKRNLKLTVADDFVVAEALIER
jgi:2-C-methyl-D-erythritol 4-phosphate cytidylyltransferase